MKKIIPLLLVCSIMLSCLTGCGIFGGNNGGGENSGNSGNSGGESGGNNLPGTPDTPNIPDTPGTPDTPDDPNLPDIDTTELCVMNSSSATVAATEIDGGVEIELTDTQSSASLLVRVPVDSSWDTVKVTQGDTVKYAKVYEKGGVAIVDVSIISNSENAIVTPEIHKNDKTLESAFGTTLSGGVKVDTNYYPGFVRKAVTFTIDDGKIDLDTKFLDIVGPAGIKGTFNLNRVTDAETAVYLALYDGYEVANHHQLHAVPFRDPADYYTGKSFESLIKDEIWNSATADTSYVYKTKTEGLYYINYHYFEPSAIGKTIWHAMATNETYFEYAEITKENIEAVFGEGSVVGFAYPNGILTETVKQYLKDAGYLYARKTGAIKATTGFALPADRFEWSYNADVNSLLSVMAQFDAYADDGELKFFSFGVHSKDFETAEGGWDTLRQFAELYGNRSDDFYYATNRAIFEYEDAVKALEIKNDRIINNSNIAVFVTVNNEKVVIPANSIYYYDGRVEASVVFDADNGTANTISSVASIGKLTKPQDPTKAGFIFDGWYVGEKKWNFNEIVVSGMTLTAKWVADTYTGPTAEVLAVKGGASGIVALIHDDGTVDSGLVLDRLYLKHGLVGDVALYTKNATALYTQWNSILGTGRWGLISHSSTHTWWGTVTKDADGNITSRVVDEAKMYDEIVASQTILRNLFPEHRVLTFAWPGFSDVTAGLTIEQWLDTVYSAEARALVDQYYISARNYRETNAAYVTEKANWNYLDGYFLTPTLINSTGSSGLKNRLESAANDGRILLLSVHKVSDSVAEGTWDSSGVLSSADMEKALIMVNEYVDSGKVWNAHYEDAILYVREAQTATVTASGDENCIKVLLTDEMDDAIYNYALTVRVDVPGSWKAAKITQGDKVSYAIATYADGRYYIDADIVPDAGEASIVPVAVEDIPYTPVETPKPTPNFDNLVPEIFDDSEIIKEGATVTTANTTSATASVEEENGNKYLSYNKHSTSSGNQLIITKTTDTTGADAVLFQIKIRHTHLSDSNSCSYFQFYDAGGKTKISSANYYFNAGKGDATGNVTLDGVNTGIAEGEWFTLAFKIFAGKVEVLVNGTLIKTLTVDGAENIGQIRLRSDAAMLHQTDVDEVYFGIAQSEGGSDNEGGSDDEGGEDTVKPIVSENFDNLTADSAWSTDMVDSLEIKTVNQGTSDTLTVRDESGNKYLEYIKNTSGKKGILEFWNNSAVSDNVIFQAKMRVNSYSNVNFATFLFYSLIDGSYKTPYYPTGTNNYYISAADNGNVTLGGKDTGVKVGEWFTIEFKIGTDALEILVNGSSFQSYTVSGIHGSSLVRLQSVANDRLYDVDFDEVYYGPASAEEEEIITPADPVDFEGIEKDTAWTTDMTDDVVISNYWPTAAEITVREEDGNKYLEYDKNTASKGMVEFIRTSDVPAGKAYVFQTEIRHTHVSETTNCSYFQFYSYVDGSYKSQYSLSNAFFSVDSESGNVTICGKDSGVAEGKWFTLTMKFTTDTIEILVNGTSLVTFEVAGIHNTAVIRVRSDANMQHKTDFDDVYFGVAI